MPKTKLKRFLILGPSKYKMAPVRNTAFLQTKTAPFRHTPVLQTKSAPFLIPLPSKHKPAGFHHTDAFETQNCTVPSYSCIPNKRAKGFVILLPSKQKTAAFRHIAVLQIQNCCFPNRNLYCFVTLLPS
jgi:hypothetical protein